MKEGIEAKMKELEEKGDDNRIPGQEASIKSKYGEGGTTAQNEAVDEAAEKGHEADPY